MIPAIPALPHHRHRRRERFDEPWHDDVATKRRVATIQVNILRNDRRLAADCGKSRSKLQFGLKKTRLNAPKAGAFLAA